MSACWGLASLAALKMDAVVCIAGAVVRLHAACGAVQLFLHEGRTALGDGAGEEKS